MNDHREETIKNRIDKLHKFVVTVGDDFLSSEDFCFWCDRGPIHDEDCPVFS